MKRNGIRFIIYSVIIALIATLTFVASACTSKTTTLTVTQTVTQTVTVPAPTLSSIAITPVSPENFEVGSTQQFTAMGTYSDDSNADITSQVTWVSSDTSIATISEAGLATGVAAGVNDITASLSGVTSPAVTLTVNVPAPTLSSIAVMPVLPDSLVVGSTQQFTATGTYSDGSTADITSQVTWVSSDTSIATISEAGLATGVAAGVTDITASFSGVTSSVITLTIT